ncbi:Glutathione transport system permease protein GsiC [Klebsiella pneumoniae]|nr:Glutathione transport system permease protein GsiC [Klebsiella pneumoniae]
MPIDPVLAIVGPDADQSTYQQVYQQLGFDKSLTTQFGIYFVNLLHGDLGNALLTGKPVVDDIIASSRPPWSWQRWRLLSARVWYSAGRVGGSAAQ